MDQKKTATNDRRKILFFRAKSSETPSTLLLGLTALSAIIYFLCMAFVFERGSMTLFILLMAGEVFHVWLALTYLFTISKTDAKNFTDPSYAPEVDVFVTVAGEPAHVVEQTVLAAKAMEYPKKNIHILNDGYVAKKENWREMEVLAKKLGVNCITRTAPGGAKAGNINNALRETGAKFFVIFDADHVPNKDFLMKTMGYFADPKVAIVQTPQFYKNRGENYITGGAWEQQEIFFGPILKGKNRTNSVFMCGTNMAIRREAILSAGGMNESITEDFVTSIFIHQKGWKSVYVPEVLAEGLAPEDFLSYYKQQFRWARGSLEILFKYNPIFMKGLTWAQKLEYLSSSSFYLSGSVVFLNAIFPIVFFFTGLTPFNISTMALAAVFLPYMFLMAYTLQRSSNYAYTYRALAMSMGSFPIHLSALWGLLTRKKASFNVTSKTQISGNFLYLAVPHLLYILAVVIGIAFGFMRDGLSASLINNSAWAFFNVAVFTPFIFAAMPAPTKTPAPNIETDRGTVPVRGYKASSIRDTASVPKVHYFTRRGPKDSDLI